jgi:hypothetical protein
MRDVKDYASSANSYRLDRLATCLPNAPNTCDGKIPAKEPVDPFCPEIFHDRV